MSLPAVSFEDWLYVNRKSGTGREVGGCTVRLKEVWLCLGSAVEQPWLAIGWPISLLLCTMGSQTCSSSSVCVGPPFLAVKLFPYQDRRSLAESHDW